MIIESKKEPTFVHVNPQNCVLQVSCILPDMISLVKFMTTHESCKYVCPHAKSYIMLMPSIIICRYCIK